jgi:hypothetical protein
MPSIARYALVQPRPPLGAVGGGVDATLLHGVAVASLERFVSWMAAEIVAMA